MIKKDWPLGEKETGKYPKANDDILCNKGDQLIFTGSLASAATARSWINRMKTKNILWKDAKFNIFITAAGVVVEYV